MAQDVTLNPTDTSGGAVIHTDELSSGAHVQRIKVGIGNPGVYTDVSAANPFPVSAVQSGAWAVSDGAVVASLATIASNQLADGHNVTVDNASIAVTQSGAWTVSDGAVVTRLGQKLDVSVGSTVVVSNAGTFAVQATQSGAWAVSDGAVVSKINTVLGNTSLVTSGAIRVNLDSSNVSIGGGTQYSVGTSGVESAGVGTLMIGVRDDALTTLSSGQGQAVPLRVDSTGALWVAAAPGAAESTDGATVHSSGVTRQVNVGFISEPNTVSVGANTIGMAAMNSQRAIHVSIREDSVGIGGGTQYTEDAAAAANPVGNASILVRADTPAGITTTNGDNVAQRGTDYGAAFVQLVTSSGSFIDSVGGGTQYSVGTSGLASAGTGNLMIGVRDDALSTLSSGEGQAIPLRVDSTGALWVNNVGTAPTAVSDGAVVAALAGTLSVSVGSTVTVAGTVTANAGSGTMAVSDGAVVAALGGVLQARIVGASSTQISDGGNSITVDNNGTFAVQASQAGAWAVSDGAVVARLGQKLDVSVGSTITVAGTVTANAGSGTMAVSDGAVVALLQTIDNPVLAHDTAVGTTQTMMAGARATNNIEGLTQVAANDGTRLTADLNGCLVIRPHTTPEEIITYHDQTVTTGSIAVSSGFTAGGSGIHNYITDVTLTNTSATDTFVQLRDGTGGAVKWTFPVPANGGVTHSFATPLKFADNTIVAFDPRVAVTTLYISLAGFQAQG